MANREFLQLAHNFNPVKHGIAGWYVSEKMDGMRAYWDGGVSRGVMCSDIAFANTTKDARLIEAPVATGLWSRYAKPIHAPDWFLNMLPSIPLDGELFLGRGKFQELISVVKQHKPDERWKEVVYVVFDSPGDFNMFMPGKINNPNCKMELELGLWEEIAEKRSDGAPVIPFHRTLNRLWKNVEEGYNLQIANQVKLPSITAKAMEAMEDMLDYVTTEGGEGLILRKPESIWEPKRSKELLKVKKLLDSEAKVTGYTWGKGKLEGLMGACIVQWRDKTFELSGFTDAERKLTSDKNCEPGTVVSSDVYNLSFPRGSIVTFRYTEVSNEGIPLKARYYRMP